MGETAQSTGPKRHTSRRKKVIIGIVVAIVAVCVACQVGIGILMNQMFGREDPVDTTRISYRYADVADELDRTPVSFPSGDNTLRGYLYAPDNTRGLVVFSHGAGPGHEGYINDIKQMTDRGFVVLAFDTTGCGESDGEATRGLEQAVTDLDACLDYIGSDARLSQMPLILMGHSQGAYASCAVLAQDHPEVDAVISISGFDKAMDAIVGQGRWMGGDVAVLFTPFLWVDDRLEFGDQANYSAVQGLNATADGEASGVPALIVHGTGDELLAYDSASLNAQADRIADANVTYLAISTEGSNGHNSILLSPAANAERQRANDVYNQTAEAYGGSDQVPDSERQRIIDESDRELANQSNPELYGAVDAFLASYGL
jgi:alpha-beta hydrolase superfamily lysophospholipase